MRRLDTRGMYIIMDQVMHDEKPPNLRTTLRTISAKLAVFDTTIPQSHLVAMRNNLRLHTPSIDRQNQCPAHYYFTFVFVRQWSSVLSGFELLLAP